MAVEPLYVGLASEFVREIRGGRYPVGSLLPTEIELAAQRKVSRATARAALNYLASLGLVSRHKGIGTRVEASVPTAEYNPSATTIEDLVHYDAATDRRVEGIDRIVADEALAHKIGARAGSRWVRISTTRRDPVRNTVPICWTDSYLDERFEEAAYAIADTSGLIISLVSRMYGIAVEEVRQSIQAVGVPQYIAPSLASEPGDYALEIIRRYLDARRVPPLITISIHPSDRFAYTSILRRPRFVREEKQACSRAG